MYGLHTVPQCIAAGFFNPSGPCVTQSDEAKSGKPACGLIFLFSTIHLPPSAQPPNPFSSQSSELDAKPALHLVLIQLRWPCPFFFLFSSLLISSGPPLTSLPLTGMR